MCKLDKDIEKIKLARMKSEEKFIYNILKILQKSQRSILEIEYFHDNIHSYSYMKYYIKCDSVIYYNRKLFMKLINNSVMTEKNKITLLYNLERLILSLTNKYFNMNFRCIEIY